MSPLAVASIVFVCVFGGGALGLFLRRLLPEHHLSEGSMGVVGIAGTSDKPCPRSAGTGCEATDTRYQRQPGKVQDRAQPGYLGDDPQGHRRFQPEQCVAGGEQGEFERHAAAVKQEADQDRERCRQDHSRCR